MSTGMIWFSHGSNEELHNALKQALDDYQHWYGVRPRVCQAHPHDLRGIRFLSHKFHLQSDANTNLEPGQFWLGG